jgi:hypothetical protein
MVIFGVIFVALLATAGLIDWRTRAHERGGFAVVEVLVVGTFLAIAIAAFIVVVGSVHSV